MNNKNKIITNAIIYILLLFVLFIVVYPVFWMVMSSVKPSWEVTTRPFQLPSKLLPNNYIKAWKQADFGSAFINTIIILSVSLVGILLISCMGGYVFAKMDFPGKKFLFYFWITGMMIPPNVSIIPNFLIMNELGLINNFLSLIFLYYSSTSFGVFVMRSFFLNVPSEILEAARIDGCSEGNVFWRVAVPIARGGLTTIAIFYFVHIWNDFMYPLTFITSESKYTISLALMSFRDIYTTDWGALTAALSMASLPPIIFYFIFQKQFIRGLTAGALKG